MATGRHVLHICRSNLIRKQRHISALHEASSQRPFATNANANYSMIAASTDDEGSHSHVQEYDHRVRSLYDNSTDWKDWFSAAEYTSPWENENSWLDQYPVSLDFAPADYATRHLVQLLQELFHAGRPLTYDRITTERCNHALQLLLKMNEIQGRAFRADAILQTMELFDTYQASTIVGADPASLPSSSRQQRQRQHKLPLEIPKPNRFTYNTLLQLYARTRGSREIPLRCQALVEKMEWRYRVLGELDMKPHAFHWDQVLLAWKECTDWDKAAHAAKIFLEKRSEGLVDVTAYITLLRICGHDHANEKAALLGANVAVKLWQVVMEETDGSHSVPSVGPTVEDLPSHFYGHFLQAIRCLPTGRMRDYYFDACFAAARKNGKVNAVIINEFIVHVNSPKVFFGQWLAPYKDRVRGKPPKQAAGILFECIPAEWKARADLR
jgi:hypothetical protein